MLENELVREGKEGEGIETPWGMKLPGKAYSRLGWLIWCMVQAPWPRNEKPGLRIMMFAGTF